MELLLWRWSTTVQVSSAVMIAAFFLALAPSVRRVEVRPWVGAWLANLAAMVVTVTYWYVQPTSPAAQMLLRFGYVAGKTAFVVLLLIGAVAFSRPGWQPRTASLRALGPVLVVGLVTAVLADSIDAVGVVQAAVVAVGMGGAAFVLVRRRVPGSVGLVLGLGLRSLLGAVESVAYATQLGVLDADPSPSLSVFLASHSALDTGAEWVIVLGSLMVLYRTIQLELLASNDELRDTQKTLQGLVDKDPLTGLANRRSMPRVMREAFATGATVLFFDLDDLKDVNDSLGHAAGDTCLRTFARLLASTFRPGDKVMRFGGDEFVVVAPDALPEQVLGRVDELRTALKAESRSLGVRVGFSVGHSYMAPGGDADEAVADADADMYQDKGLKGTRTMVEIPGRAG